MEFSVSPSKIVDYLLKEPGKRKFFVALGYSSESWQTLQSAILELAARHGSSIRLRQETKYGKEFELLGEIVTASGRTIALRTASYLDAGEAEVCRFITAYPA